jgi:hypothetical protein
MITWVQSQSNKPKKALDCKEKQPKFLFIYVLPFKTMEIMTSCFFIHMNVKEFKPKSHLIKF